MGTDVFFQNYYKGYSLHDYKFKKIQECTTQRLTSKPMYKERKCMWGCTTWCKYYTTIKPCVCACSQDLKLAVQQALELLVPSSLQSFRTKNFTACSLFLVSLLPHLHCCQLWLLLFMLQLQYQSIKRKRSSSNLRTQETSKQKKPKNSKLRKIGHFQH